MELTVTFRHLEPNDALRSHAKEKVSRIEKYNSNINEVHVLLSMEKRTYIAEVIVNVNKAKLTAKQVHDENMYTAIDLVMDKIDRQVRKHKDKITSHKDQHRKAQHKTFSYDETESSSQPNVVRTESVSIEPMNVDEAVSHIETRNDDYLVFKNAETEKVNVLYRRRDGLFGLIEPENV